MPIAAFIDFRFLLVLRIIQGFVCGVVWPSMHNMTAQWIPPDERSTFVTSYMGSSVGVAVFFPLFGFLISWASWEWVFHLCAVTGSIWFVAWHYLAFDTPRKHPRIEPEELAYIELSLGVTSSQDTHKKVFKLLITHLMFVYYVYVFFLQFIDSVDVHNKVGSGLGQCNCFVGRCMGPIHSYDTGSNILSYYSWLEYSNDGHSVRSTTLDSNGILVLLFSV